MTGLVARQHGDDVPQRSREVSAARGLLDRKTSSSCSIGL